jgi:hypothetical protein
MLSASVRCVSGVAWPLHTEQWVTLLQPIYFCSNVLALSAFGWSRLALTGGRATRPRGRAPSIHFIKAIEQLSFSLVISFCITSNRASRQCQHSHRSIACRYGEDDPSHPCRSLILSFIACYQSHRKSLSFQWNTTTVPRSHSNSSCLHPLDDFRCERKRGKTYCAAILSRL